MCTNSAHCYSNTYSENWLPVAVDNGLEKVGMLQSVLPSWSELIYCHLQPKVASGGFHHPTGSQWLHGRWDGEVNAWCYLCGQASDGVQNSCARRRSCWGSTINISRKLCHITGELPKLITDCWVSPTPERCRRRKTKHLFWYPKQKKLSELFCLT